MSNILETIVAYKKKEIEKRKLEISIQQLKSAETSFNREGLSLEHSLKDPERTGIIAEFKRKSPSKGVINAEADVLSVTRKYVEYGASGLSVLTDDHFFGGSVHDLEDARLANEIPILRKEFIVDEYQILEAKSIGADVILLIAECLTKEEIVRFTATARDLGLEVLLELHSEEMLEKIGTGNTMVGINNRDLKTFIVDVDRSIALANKLPEKTVKIAESGINEVSVIRKMKAAGFDGFLMGEHFMKQEHPGEAFGEFVNQLRLVD